MIATSIQWIGWTKPSAGPEKQVPSVTQTEPTTPSFAAGQQQMTQDLAALRQTAEQLAGGQDQMARESPIPHVLNALRCYMKAKNQKCYM